MIRRSMGIEAFRRKQVWFQLVFCFIGVKMFHKKYANFDRIQTLKFRFGSDQGDIQLPDIKTRVCVF